MFKKVSGFLALIVSLIALLSLAATHAQQTSNNGSNQTTATPPSNQPQEQKQAAGSTPQSPQKQQGDDRIKLDTDLVSLTVTVTDPYNRLVTGLEQKNFEVFEDKVKQKIEHFKDDDVPVSVGIAFDISGSMKGKLDRARDALKAFVDTSHSDDDFFLIAFNQRTNLISEFSDGATLLNKLTLIDAKGQTALYDASYLGIEKVKQGRHDKRAILLISDGQDNSSRYTYTELRKLLKEAGVQIYCIGIVEMGGGAGSSLDMQGQGMLEEIAQSTGGKAFFPRSAAELEDATTRIALELRHQYSLSYMPTNEKRDSQWHKIKIKVTPPRGLPPLNVRHKDGYYALPKNTK